MKLRSLVAGAAGAAGAAAITNRALANTAGDLPPALPGDQGTYRWRGMDVSYSELGDPEAPDLLLLHGLNVSASSHEFASVAADLAEEFHVIAPDLPGFGRSDRPPLVYSGSIYEGFVTDFVRDVTDEPIVVASSLSGAYATRAAGDTDVSRLVLICPTDDTMPGERLWLRTLARSPFLGTTLHNLVTSKAAIRYFSADHGYYDERNVDDEHVEYQWKSAHQPRARYAPASFLSGHLDPDVDLGEELAELDIPKTLVWGREAETTPLSEGRTLAERADARLVVIDYTKLLPHVEHPETFMEVVNEELSLAKHE